MAGGGSSLVDGSAGLCFSPLSVLCSSEEPLGFREELFRSSKELLGFLEELLTLDFLPPLGLVFFFFVWTLFGDGMVCHCRAGSSKPGRL